MDQQAAIAKIRARYARLEDDTLYEFLDLEPDATTDEIRKAYRKLAREFHVDRFRGLDLGDDAPRLEAIFARLSEAQSTLTSDEKRERYDKSLRGEDDEVSAAQMEEIFAAEEAFRRGKLDLQRGQYEKARERFELVVKVNPDDPDSKAYYAFSVFITEPVDDDGRRSKAARKARDTLEKLSKKHDDLPTPTLLRARVLKLEGKTSEAHRLFKRVLRLDPKNADAEREVRLMNQRKNAQREESQGGGFLAKIRSLFSK